MKKKILSFAGIVAYGIGSVGGFGAACYCGSYVNAACVVVLACFAFPTAKRLANDLIWGDEKGDR